MIESMTNKHSLRSQKFNLTINMVAHLNNADGLAISSRDPFATSPKAIIPLHLKPLKHYV
jgi:hypothetical protein